MTGSSLFQLHVEGFEPRLVTSSREAKKEAQALSLKGYASTIHRLTPEGAKFVAAYGARSSS